MVNRNSNIAAVTGLRFAAAFYVFLFHVNDRWPLHVPSLVSALLSKGAAGMTLFFVLSGYVLSLRYSNRNIDYREYFWNRVARIYPVYVLAAIITIPFLFMQLKGSHYLPLKMASLIAIDTGVVQAWFPQTFALWNNSASWSISAEAFFYLSFLALAPAMMKVKRLWVAGLLAYAASVLPGFVYLSFRDQSDLGLPVFYAMPIFRVGEFAAGMVAYEISKTWNGRFAAPVFLASLAAFVSYQMTPGIGGIHVTNNWIVVPLMCLLVASSAKGSGSVFSVIGSRPFVYLGEISYGFYSYQAFVLFSMVYLAPPHSTEGYGLIIPGFLVLLALSATSFHWFEEPLRKAIRKFSAPRILPEPIPVI